jgi:hypothetical protein
MAYEIFTVASILESVVDAPVTAAASNSSKFIPVNWDMEKNEARNGQ